MSSTFYVCLFVLVTFVVLRSPSLEMDRLVDLDISPGVPKVDFLLKLRRIDVSILKSIRIGLFNTAKRNDLVHQYDLLVERRNTATRPVTWKLAEDIWELRTCVQMNKMVPRTLLRSGKRSKQQLDVQRVKTKEKMANHMTFSETAEREQNQVEMGEGYGGVGLVEGDGGGQMGGEQNDSETQGDMTGGRVEEGDTIEAGGEDIHGICGDGNVEGRDEDGKGCGVGLPRSSFIMALSSRHDCTSHNKE